MKPQEHAIEYLAQWELWAREQAYGLRATVERDAEQLLTNGVDVPPGTSAEDRLGAMGVAWARVDDGRRRATNLRIIAYFMARTLRDMGGEPIYKSEFPTFTRLHDEDEIPDTARQGIELDRSKVEASAAKHGLLESEVDDGAA